MTTATPQSVELRIKLGADEPNRCEVCGAYVDDPTGGCVLGGDRLDAELDRLVAERQAAAARVTPGRLAAETALRRRLRGDT